MIFGILEFRVPWQLTLKPSTTALEQAALLLLCTRFPFWLSISLANKSYGKLNSHASNLIGIQLQQKKIVFLYPVDGANLISWLLKVPITIQFTNARERFFLAKLSSPYYTAIRNKFVFKTKRNFLYRLDGQVCNFDVVDHEIPYQFYFPFWAGIQW